MSRHTAESLLFDLLAQNNIKPIIKARMPFAEARRAHELIEQTEVQGKIVLTVRNTTSNAAPTALASDDSASGSALAA